MHLNVATLYLYLVSVICITHSGCELHAGPMSEYDCRSAANHCPQGFSCLADDTGRHMCFEQTVSANLQEVPPECGTNPCAACTAGCSQSDTCEEGTWTCVCDCSDIDLETEEDGAISDEDAANEAEAEPLDVGAMTDPDSDVDNSSAMEANTDPGTETPPGRDTPAEVDASQLCHGSSDDWLIEEICTRFANRVVECLPEEEREIRDTERLRDDMLALCAREDNILTQLWCLDRSCETINQI